ncbi:MAG: hypothetical protein J3R72DRAFT_455941 [Linnemannia gamsii]|nr:MAG: hypothetical protein J3R72DRAFT_455941 [Linnemannia gamsii]
MALVLFFSRALGVARLSMDRANGRADTIGLMVFISFLRIVLWHCVFFRVHFADIRYEDGESWRRKTKYGWCIRVSSVMSERGGCAAQAQGRSGEVDKDEDRDRQTSKTTCT